MQRRRFYLADNPVAGYGPRRLLGRVIAGLERLGACVTRMHHGSAGEAEAALRHAAASGAFDALLAAGGDGTVRLAAKAALGTGLPVGVISLGTGNVLAHEAGLPRQPDRLAELLVQGEARPVNAARANGELFLLMAGVGLDARIVAALDQRTKKRLGKLAYMAPVLRGLVQATDALEVWVDGARHHAGWIVVANASRYGGRFAIAPRTGVEAPGLEAILFRGDGRAARVGQLLAIATGRIEGRTHSIGGDVTMLSCRRVEIRSSCPVPGQIDGDPFATTPLLIEDAGPVVRLILPPRPRAET